MSKAERIDIMKEHIAKIMEHLGVKPPPAFIEELHEIIAFRATLSEETDRGCALMAASFLEHRTTELLKSYLVRNDALEKTLYSSNGPLSTFSAKIDIAFSLALIPESMRRDLHVLRKIRNDFAHTPEEISFETPAIADRCRALSYAGESEEPRDCFTRAMLGIDGSIFVKILLQENIEAMPDENLEERAQMFSALMNIPIEF